MARKRKTQSNTTSTVVDPNEEVSNITETATNGNYAARIRREIVPLTNDRIREIYAKRRTKGLYTSLLAALLESGDNGCDVKETWPQLLDKKASTIKQGFENAKNTKDAPEGADNVDVIVDGEDVFLINTSVVGDMAEASA